MPCFCVPPNRSKLEWVEYMLCQAFRKLSPEQILEIKSYDGYYDPISWYHSHLGHDFDFNDADEKELAFYQKEAARFGWKFGIAESGNQILFEIETEKE